MGTTMPILSWAESGAGQEKELQDWIGNDCDKEDVSVHPAHNDVQTVLQDALNQWAQIRDETCEVRRDEWYKCTVAGIRTVFCPDLMVHVASARNFSVDYDGEGYDGDRCERPPSLLVEMLSRSTRRRDLVDKLEVYQGLGVEEYWIFDAQGKFRDASVDPLQGGALPAGVYQPLPLTTTGTEWVMESRLLQTHVPCQRDARGWWTLRIWDTKTQTWLLAGEETDRKLAEPQARLTAKDVEIAAQQDKLRKLSRILQAHGIDPSTALGNTDQVPGRG